MKILHVLKSGQFSGAENVVIQIIKMMNSYEDNQSVYASSKGSIENILIDNDIEYYLFDRLSLKNVKKAIDKIKPDVIHAHDFQASIICSLLRRDMMLISHIHSNPDWLKKINLKTISYLICSIKFNKILTVSPKISKEFRFNNLIEKKMLNIGNPINTDEIRKIAVAKTSLNEFESDVIFVGRLESVKNPIRFINIINQVREKIPNVKAVMLGNGSLYKKCEESINDLSLNKNITLLGFQENPYKYIEKSKMLCITSENEGYSLVAIEAISLSKPVISLDVGEVSNIIDDSCGLVTENELKLVDELIHLLQNDRILANKSIAAYEKSRKLDNFYDYKNTLYELYGCN